MSIKVSELRRLVKGGSTEGNKPSRFLVGIVAAVLIMVCILSVLFYFIITDTGREKLEISKGFDSLCIKDSDSNPWFKDTSETSKILKLFFDKTGIQPYIVINEYNPSLKSDEDMDLYAEGYYISNIGASNGIMFMYFPESSDSNEGYTYLFVSDGAEEVMDKDAQSTFWGYYKSFSDSGMSSGDVIVNSLNSTADSIMSMSSYTKVACIVISGIVLILSCVFIFFLRDRKVNQ